MTRRPDSIVVIDCHYKAPQRAAAYLIREPQRAAFVDNNTVRAVPRLLDALSRAGLAPADVEYLIVTHVHLDHAGGTAALLEHCPNATVLAHPKAARHLAAPERLVAGAKAVYGEETFARLYGEIRPVPEARIRVIQDNEEIRWGGRCLRFLHTLGHATHHMCIHDSGSNGVFTGDAFGLGLNEAVRPGPSFFVATTAPTDFDPDEARKTVRRIVETGADWACLAHFSVHADLAGGAEKLLHSIDQMEDILQDAAGVPDADLEAYCQERMHAATEEQLRRCGVADLAHDLRWLHSDMDINAMGLAHVVRTRRTRS